MKKPDSQGQQTKPPVRNAWFQQSNSLHMATLTVKGCQQETSAASGPKFTIL